jgi:hypothetical protein
VLCFIIVQTLVCSVPCYRHLLTLLAKAKANSIINYDSFIVQATVITIINYDRNTFIEEAADFKKRLSNDSPERFYFYSKNGLKRKRRQQRRNRKTSKNLTIIERRNNTERQR